jgi:NAD(P)-dependent dehydrogenase (short-subunit alcohol dehydrogenase family)
MFDFKAPETKSIDELLSLDGKVAVVTGGSRGIGKQIVRRFTEAGAKVVITGRGLEALQKVESELRAGGADVTLCQADVSSVPDSRKVVDFTVETYGRLDILVNNAASFPFCDALSVTEEVWDKCFDTDAKGTFFMSRFAAEQMIKQKQGGRIINFMSTAALNPTAPLIAYGAAKQAVWYVTRTMAQEFAKYKITVNAATPGATMTEERIAAFGGDRSQMKSFIEKTGSSRLSFAKNVASLPAEKIVGMLKQAMPMGRTGFPDDLAKAVLFLASDMGEYVTGQNITVDGAQSIQNPMGAMMKKFADHSD